jgi:tetratricopeptide (TPR) repeat protein
MFSPRVLWAFFAFWLVSIAFGMTSADSQSAQQRQSGPDLVPRMHFATSCDHAVEQQFDRAVAALHSFWFSEAIREFRSILANDSHCAMANWGIAISDLGFRGQLPALRAGAAAIHQAEAQLDDAKTQREKDYINALAIRYEDIEHTNTRTRVLAYEKAMEQLTAKYPEDREAVLFYALAILDTVVPTDKTYAARLKAGAILEREFKIQPDHPGISHYIIHAYDVPDLAPRALGAARHYATIAPNVPHPLHMPSHIFTRLGDWEESIESNSRSAAAAAKEGPEGVGERLHALDYEIYARLQTAQDQAAFRIVNALPRIAQSSDSARYGAANFFAVAAIPARYALERHAWTEATKLPAHTSDMPYADAMTYFARALGFAHTRQATRAASELDRIIVLRDKLKDSKDMYWAGQVEIERLSAAGWIAMAEGRTEQAESLLRAAADQEDATEKPGTAPGPLMPARELLADMLLELKQPGQALREYERATRNEPNRFWSIFGSARAAQLSGDREKAARYYRRLLEICRHADRPGRHELELARAQAQ